ncbi:MAG: hypothetical protein HXX17_06320 [Geobacteraceae bacterium]|nr:hypothetical protein [Geobacteraceae bacterium]
MRINWKRLTVGVLILTSLSLILFGCGRSGDSGTLAGGSAPYTNMLSGRVSDPATGRGVANATVTAYAVSANGSLTNVLSSPPSAHTDALGNYSLNIFSPYSGMIMLVATLPGSSQQVRSLLSTSNSQFPITTAMVNLGTEMAVQYIVQNLGSRFTAANLQAATQVLAPFFGTNFPQVPPPVPGTTPTKPQQDLLVMTQSINTLINTIPTTTTSALVTINPNSNIIQLGTQPTLSRLNTIIPQVVTLLTSTGEIPGGYFPPVITPIPQPPAPQPDTSKPTPPTNLSYTSTSNSVTLTWGAATDNVAVTAYYIYRDGTFIGSVPASTLTFTDSLALPSTTYTYVVTAQDAASNSSNGASIQATTAAAPIVQTYTISGTITQNGTGMADVPVLISGIGSSIAITDATGKYSFNGAINGSYTIKPYLTAGTYAPVSINVAVNGADSTNNNFTASPDSTLIGGIVFPDATIIGTIIYPAGTVIGGVTYPTAVIIGSVAYPGGSVKGVIVLPAGTVVGGITFPAGTVIGGVTYPAGTIIGGVFYPSGSVVGGATYPNGTIVGGTYYPPGSVVGGITYPNGVIIGGTFYPTGGVTGGTSYPNGTIAGGTYYPPGSVVGGVTYPVGVIIGGTFYPTGAVSGGTAYPNGTIVGGTYYPPGSVVGGITYPNGVIIGGTFYPTGGVAGGTSYPNGAIAGGTYYPPGSIVNGITYPGGVILGGTFYPTGGVSGSTIYTNGTIVGGTFYPSGTVTGGTTYPNGVVIGGVTFPSGTVIGGVALPPGALSGAVFYPPSSVSGSTIFSVGGITETLSFPQGGITGSLLFP